MYYQFSPKQTKPISILLALAGVYIALFVVSNLIFKKFVYIPLGFTDFELSAGLIAFPATFLVTDIISEIYGKKISNLTVIVAFLASFVTIAIISLVDYLQATSWSVVSDQDFAKVFGSFDISILCSLAASMVSQFLDIYIFHYVRDLTKAKHLWLRNNISTIISQFFDTLVILSLLGMVGIIHWQDFGNIFKSSYSYKLFFTLLDTPFAYLFIHLIRKQLRLN
jgi:uncharacterized integral membrane protein (TIGR00697 family)